MPAFNSLPLDYTGKATTNLVQDELHVLQDREVRTIAPVYGGYFTNSLIVRDATTNAVITRNSYKCLDVLGIPSTKASSEICSVICITDKNVPARIKITYQAVGGGYIKTYDTVKKLMDALTLDDRPAAWPNILRRPLTFTPSPHMQSIATVVGYEFVVEALDSLRSAILLGDTEGHNEILTYIDDQISTYEARINANYAADVTASLRAAQTARDNSVEALAHANQLDVDTDALKTRTDSAVTKITQLEAVNNTAVAAAKALIDDVLLDRTAVKRMPPSGNLSPVLLNATTFKNDVIDADYFSIDAAGRVSIPGDSSEFLSSEVFRVTFKTVQDPGDCLRARIWIDCKDRRSTVFYQEVTDVDQAFIANKTINDGTRDRKVYLDGGTGYYANDLSLILYPIQLSDDRVDHTPTPEDGKLLAFQPNATTLTIAYSGLTDNTYPIPGFKAEDTSVRFWILGEDDESAEGTVLNQTSVARLAKYLLDTRNEFNTLGYGDIAMRRAVRMEMVPGTSVNIDIRLSAKNISDSYRTLALPFKKKFSICRTSGWTLHASNGAITSVTEVKTVTNANPDALRIRTVAADVSSTPPDVSDAQTDLLDPPAAPRYFIAAQFETSFVNYDTASPTHREMVIKNLSTATIAIDSVEHWSAKTGDRTVLERHINLLPSKTLVYSNRTDSIINMPINAVGGGADYAEQIRLYLTNGQLIIFRAYPGRDDATVQTSTGEEIPEYVPVFTSLVFNPASAVKGATSQLTATFTGLKPSAVTSIDVTERTGADPGSISLTANASGAATFTWPVVVGTANTVTHRIGAAGTTRTATLTRAYTAKLSGLSITPTSGIEGASAVLKAEFTALKPSATNTITITAATGFPKTAISVDANASGYGFHTWPVVVGDKDTTFSITVNGDSDDVVLYKRYVPTFEAAVFNPTGSYNRRTPVLVCKFSNLRPSENTDVVINLDPSGDTDGPSGDQTVSLRANSAGDAQTTFEYDMNNTDISVVARYKTTAKTATCLNAGPDLNSVSFTTASAKEGSRIRLAISLKNVPTYGSNTPTPYEITASNGYAQMTGSYGQKNITVPSGEDTYVFYHDFIMGSATNKIDVTMRGVTKTATINFAASPELESVTTSAGRVSTSSSINVYLNFSGLIPNATNTISSVALAEASGLNLDARAWGTSGATGFGTRTVSVSADEDGNGSARVVIDITGYGQYGVTATLGSVTKTLTAHKVHDVEVPTIALQHAVQLRPDGNKSAKCWAIFRNDGTTITRKRNYDDNGDVRWDGGDNYVASWIPGASETVSKEQYASLYEIAIETISEKVTGKYQSRTDYEGPATYVYPDGTSTGGMSNVGTTYESLAQASHCYTGVTVVNDWRLVNKVVTVQKVTIRHASTDTVLSTKNITFTMWRENPHPDFNISSVNIQASSSTATSPPPYIKFRSDGKMVYSVNGGAEIQVADSWITDADTESYGSSTSSEYKVAVTPTAYWVDGVPQSSILRSYLIGALATAGGHDLVDSPLIGVDTDAVGYDPGWTNRKYKFTVDIKHVVSQAPLAHSENVVISSSVYVQEQTQN